MISTNVVGMIRRLPKNQGKKGFNTDPAFNLRMGLNCNCWLLLKKTTLEVSILKRNSATGYSLEATNNYWTKKSTTLMLCEYELGTWFKIPSD